MNPRAAQLAPSAIPSRWYDDLGAGVHDWLYKSDAEDECVETSAGVAYEPTCWSVRDAFLSLRGACREGMAVGSRSGTSIHGALLAEGRACREGMASERCSGTQTLGAHHVTGDAHRAIDPTGLTLAFTSTVDDDDDDDGEQEA